MSALNASVIVDCRDWQGKLERIWNGIGFDEINLAYFPRGKALFRTLSQIHEMPYYIRNHNALTSGNGAPSPAWGAGNVFHLLPDGTAFYDWTNLDQVYDTYVEAGCRPLIELGFMPRDLSSASNQPGWYGDLGQEEYEKEGHWKYPPKDYEMWSELVYQFVRHWVDRYGKAEVESWYFELWNEPDIPNYWRGTFDEYCKLYDYSVSGAVRALATVKIGGPGTTCPAVPKAGVFLEKFLEHCVSGTNAVTGETGTRLDFISIHTKGAFYRPRRYYNLNQPIPKESPSSFMMMNDIQAGLRIISQYATLKHLPVFIDECDPAVGTPYGIYDNPNFIYRNTEFYPTFVIALARRILDLNNEFANKVKMMTNWAFYYEGKRFFEGNRVLMDNENIEKPVLNSYRLLSHLGDTRLTLQSSHRRDVLQKDAPRVEVDGIAAISGKTVTLAIWHQADEWWAEDEPALVSLRFTHLPFSGKACLKHYRIDADHSNAHTAWVRQGKPQHPSPAQIRQIKRRMGLEMLEPPQTVDILPDGTFSMQFSLPIQGTSLIEIEPEG
ncbi:MAG TPA: hypothetical protein VIO61_04850 [Anaerolineaceae bacterium]